MCFTLNFIQIHFITLFQVYQAFKNGVIILEQTDKIYQNSISVIHKYFDHTIYVTSEF